MLKEIPIIVGPTASGKSSLALQLAQHISGEIINADSLQVYQDLKILSARPQEKETQNIKHHLYGFVDAYTTYNVAQWLEDVKKTLKNVKNPIFVGGTGLYIKALTEGISQIPEIDTKIREYVRNLPIEDVQKKIKECKATDPQRLRRALEVELSTGKPLSYFQQTKIKIIEEKFKIYFLNPPRELLYKNCNNRFETMLQTGAVEEVKDLIQKRATGGVLKAIGIKEITAWLAGEISKKEMIEKASQATRNYAKRQITWFKNQFKEAMEINSPDLNLIIKK